MYMSRTLEGSTWREMMMPPFRSIDFKGQSPVRTVSACLRAAWPAAPGEEATANGMATFMREFSHKSEEERDLMPKNSDLSIVHTPWRDTIYEHWNHVFYDTMGFLQDAAMGVGHFHPPSHEVFELSYPAEGEGGVVEKVWDKNVMLIPAYLAPGVSVTMSAMEEGESKEHGTFDGSNTTTIWFLMKNNDVQFKIEGEPSTGLEGPAVVMVVGIGCNGDEQGEEGDQVPPAEEGEQ